MHLLHMNINDLVAVFRDMSVRPSALYNWNKHSLLPCLTRMRARGNYRRRTGFQHARRNGP